MILTLQYNMAMIYMVIMNTMRKNYCYDICMSSYMIMFHYILAYFIIFLSDMIISYHSIHFSWVFLTPSIENHGTQPWENPGLSYGILPSDNCGILILNHTVMVYTT